MTQSPDLRPLFPGERAALLEVLGNLAPTEWGAPTACPSWSVKDVAAHLLGDDIGRLSRGRDAFANPDFATGLDIATLPGLIAAIDRQNVVWVEGMRRVSPPLLIELLRLTGELTADYFASLDLEAIGTPIDWAGPEPAPVWLDVAREHTERWVHQQHIRDAVGRPGLKERHWFGPVLETFVLALPRALADYPAPDGAALRLLIAGEAGGGVDRATRERPMGLRQQRDHRCERDGPDRSGDRLAALHEGAGEGRGAAHRASHGRRGPR